MTVVQCFHVVLGNTWGTRQERLLVHPLVLDVLQRRFVLLMISSFLPIAVHSFAVLKQSVTFVYWCRSWALRTSRSFLTYRNAAARSACFF